MANENLIKSITKYRSWMTNEALPFWSNIGIEPGSRSAVERVEFDGKPNYSVDKRVRVQTRQIFTFGIAADQGWIASDKAKNLIVDIENYLEKNAVSGSRPELFAHLLSAEDKIIDERKDLYDIAFTLLALAWQFKILGTHKYLDRANRILELLDTELPGKNGGYLEGDYESEFRRQNPHMHLFESLLTWYEVSQDNSFLQRAGEIFKLFENFFYLPNYEVLLEYFDDEWSPEVEKQIVEPGHMLEWVWLLDWYGRLSSTDTSKYFSALYYKAYQHGFDPATGLLFDGLAVDGSVKIAKKRCWPMTELIKANLVMARHGEELCEQRASDAIELLFKYFISEQIKGSYVDHYDEESKLIVDYAPASSMYHLAMACAECCDYLDRSN